MKKEDRREVAKRWLRIDKSHFDKMLDDNDVSHEYYEALIMKGWLGIETLDDLWKLPRDRRDLHSIAHCIACVMQDDPSDCPFLASGERIYEIGLLPLKCTYCVNRLVLEKVRCSVPLSLLLSRRSRRTCK